MKYLILALMLVGCAHECPVIEPIKEQVPPSEGSCKEFSDSVKIKLVECKTELEAAKAPAKKKK
jgi:hypothetical protein